jgi:hypothetical protein
MQMKDNIELSYNLDDGEEHHVYASDLNESTQILFNEVTATLRLQKTNELFFNKILDEKILVLHEAIQSKRKGEKV